MNKAKLFCVLNYETNKVYYKEDDTYDASDLERFLDSILQVYPTGNISMVVDNRRNYKTAAFEGFVENQLRLKFMFYSRRSTHLSLTRLKDYGGDSKAMSDTQFHLQPY
ncbi:transposase [Paenibacillus sp. URB8-2]|uniref:transposase n=1 Tax=Paenibacillus sp. URB8-2 TaxID=2741301 RepID=UPI0015BEEA02